MASAVLASSQNERQFWGNSSNNNNYNMAKLPYPNHVNPNSNSNPNPNNNPNSFPKKKNYRKSNDSPAVTQANSDDAYSFNQKPIETNGNPNFNPGGYISFDLSDCSKTEMVRIRDRLITELESVRRVNSMVELGKFNTQKKKRPNLGELSNDPKKLSKKVVPVMEPGEIDSLMKLCKQILGKLMKHKLSWVFKKPVDALALGLHDYHQIVNRPMDLGTVKSNLGKNLYSSPVEFADDVRLTFNNAMLYNPAGDEVHKMAELLLDKFEELYSPIGSKFKVENVEIDELQGSSWNVSPSFEKPKKPNPNPKPKPKTKPLPVEPLVVPTEFSMPKKSERVETVPEKIEKTEFVSKKIESLPVIETVTSPPRAPVIQQQQTKPIVARERPVKLPKPKAKDPNKRAMSMEEQHKLSIGLQNLPQEKMNQLLHIIKKRNAHMVQEGDEIELDIEAIDTETLWELDRFVTNWKKMESKAKRQALMVNNNLGFAPVETETASGDDNVASASERSEVAKNLKEGEGGEDDMDIGGEVDVGNNVDVGDDVDIGDDVPMGSFAPVEIEKDDVGGGVLENIINNNNNNNNNARAASSSSSSSSSSGSDSSSSSDSDSGSSSGSDSDADDAQSKGLGA